MLQSQTYDNDKLITALCQNFSSLFIIVL